MNSTGGRERGEGAGMEGVNGRIPTHVAPPRDAKMGLGGERGRGLSVILESRELLVSRNTSHVKTVIEGRRKEETNTLLDACTIPARNEIKLDRPAHQSASLLRKSVTNGQFRILPRSHFAPATCSTERPSILPEIAPMLEEKLNARGKVSGSRKTQGQSKKARKEDRKGARERETELSEGGSKVHHIIRVPSSWDKLNIGRDAGAA